MKTKKKFSKKKVKPAANKKGREAYKCFNYLSLLNEQKSPKKRKTLIDFANKNQINAISECVYNVLNNNIKLKEKEIKKLKRHKIPLRLLADKKTSHLGKKKILKQRGGSFFAAILPTAVGILKKILGF